MKRILRFLLIVLALWCATMISAGAIYGHSSSSIDSFTPYEIDGVDARGVPFRIFLDDYGRLLQNPDLIKDIATKQILKKETDGDLRTVDEISSPRLSRNVRLTPYAIFTDPRPWPERSVWSIYLEDLENPGIEITINFYEIRLFEYPQTGKRTLLSDLLDTKTAIKAAEKLQRIVDEHGFTEEACNLIKAELEKEYTPAWVLPTAICGGAVVLAAAVAVPAVIIRRKKRQAAVADTPAEEENA